MEKKEIEQKARKTLDDSHDNGDAAVDIIKVAQNLGFVVGNVDFSDDEDGFIIVDEHADEILGQKTDKLIGVRADQTKEWKYFIIAHEIGHYVLHYDKEKYRGMYAHREHKTGKNEIENEADYFAANLLMPEERFRQHYEGLKEVGLSFDEMVLVLAKRFCVTERMTLRRLNCCK